MSDKHYHHGDLRSALVAAARTILERDGLSALSLRACAREAGVSHAAPLHHFRNLAELQSAVAASGFDDFVAFLDAQSGSAETPGDRLLAMGFAYICFSTDHPALYRLMFGVEASHVKSESLALAMSDAWLQLLGAVADAAGIDGAVEKAVFVWSLVHGYAMLRAPQYFPSTVNPDAELRKSLVMLAKGIGARVD